MHYGPQIIKNGLVLALDAADKNSYSGSGTNWNDLSGNGNNGTLTNGPTFSSANEGSIAFDGVNDYIECGNANYCNLINISVGVWVKFANNADGAQYILERYLPGINGFFLAYLTTTGKFKVDGRESSAQYFEFITNNTYTKTNWNYVVWTKTASIWSLYINGVLDNSQSFGNGTTLFSSGDLSIGAFIAPSQFFPMDGNISNAQIYNRAITSIEVLQNYNATKSRFGL